MFHCIILKNKIANTGTIDIKQMLSQKNSVILEVKRHLRRAFCVQTCYEKQVIFIPLDCDNQSIHFFRVNDVARHRRC